MGKTASTAAPFRVQVSGKHMDVGAALRQRITEELDAGIGKYFERGGDADVTVSRDGHENCVDVVLHLASGQQLEARGTGEDAHAAFSAALLKTEKRIRRYKRRLKNHHAHGPARDDQEMAALFVLRADEEGEFDEDWDGGGAGADAPPAAMVIAETQAQVKTMPVAMAVMELDMSDAPLVLFRHAGHGGLSVVYRRKDGNVGWLDPERRAAGGARA